MNTHTPEPVQHPLHSHPLYREANADKPNEECGIFACFAPQRKDVAEIVYHGLQALQHRGQESAGISVFNEEMQKIYTHKEMGLVAEVFLPEVLQNLKGIAGIGHVRYSTMGAKDLSGSQPISSNTKLGECALAHNGTISNAAGLRELLEISSEFVSDSDTEIIMKILSIKASHGIQKALEKTASLLQGSYSIALLFRDSIVGIKDPFGIRPLCIGQLDDHSYILASESCAIHAVGARYIREVAAGEIVSIDRNGIHPYQFTENNVPAPCAFEQIYFSRPDSIANGNNIYSTRTQIGKLLFEECKINADVVLGVPQSGIPSAIGYSEASGIPYEMGILKNQYTKRSFINPTHEMRTQEISAKLTIVPHIVKDKTVIVIDDSLVRGNTSRQIVAMLKKNGASKVHFMSASPPVKFPCYFGIDISRRNELLANSMDEQKLATEIGADSLHYLSLANLKRAFNNTPHCFGCFTGTYPTFAPRELE